jgi:CDP-glucose 4,6-dehydratase
LKQHNGDFWFGKNVLITGGDGFVASNIASFLIKMNANVVVVVRHQRPISTLKLLGLDDVLPDIEQSDLSDLMSVRKICDRHQIDTIFHLAASSIVSDASQAPLTTCENNILPTLNILETARINEIPRILVASSDKSYGDHADINDPERIPYKEYYSLRGLDIYSASKVCLDIISQTYALQFRLPVISVRACNIYGPGDLNFTRLIPKTILRLLMDYSPVINLGNAGVLREYIYVEDVVRAYLFLAENVEQHYKDLENIPKTGLSTYGWSAYNVGSYDFSNNKGLDPKECPNIKSVADVIGILQIKLDKQNLKSIDIPKPVNFIEIPDQYLDSSKIINLGFEPQVSLDDGLDLAANWYRNNRDYFAKVAWKYLER